MSQISPSEASARIAHMHDLLEKVIQVNGFFISAGYGTFFGVWAVSRDALGLDERIWSCLFLLSSATVFISWHLYGLLSMNFVIKSLAADPAEGWVARAKAALMERNSKIIQRLGIPMTLLSAALGATGVAILATGLVRSL